MTLIYKPKGRAFEYSPLACNLFVGCRYGCTYCYNRSMYNRFYRKKLGREFNEPTIKSNVLEQLSKEAPKYKGQEIFMSFSTDPFQGISEFDEITFRAIEIVCKESNLRILTKSDMNAIVHYRNRFKRYYDKITYGITLDRKDMFRIDALDRLKKAGIKTWVSLEPVLDPDISIAIIERSHFFVDEFRVGKWNHDKRADSINWHKFVNEAIELLEKYGKKYMIKEDLKKYIKKDVKHD